MRYSLSGKTIDTCMIGTWAWGTGTNGGKFVFGKNYDEQTLRETFDTAYDLGFNFWDTAEVYGMGSAESLLGSLIKDKDIIISTKHFPGKKYKKGENTEAVQGSLERLGVKKADIYWLHSPQNITDNMKELTEIQKTGLIGSIGISNANADQIRLADMVLHANGSRLDAIQNHYSLLSMQRESKSLELCRKKGILFFGYMILEQGALSGHYDADNHFPALSVRGLSFSKKKFQKITPLIDCIRRLGKKYGVDSAQIPTAWAVAKGVIPIVGLTKPDHARGLNAGLTVILSDDEITELESLAIGSGVKCKGFWE